MNYKDTYNTWLNHPSIDEEFKLELSKMSEETIKESFYGNLSFGTAGMRGILGIGTNRLNVYTVRKATLGYANYLIKHVENSKTMGVVIGHDNRYNSRKFCLDCANLLSSQGIKVYIFDNLRPTPEISFAIRELKAAGGIIITASHNPKEYNGYKVYDETGCQLIDSKNSILIDEISKIDDILSFKFTGNETLIETLDYSFDKKYYEELKKLSLNNPNKKDFKVVYSPQHGTALNGIKEVLTELGYNIHLVESQCSPDPAFSNTLCPNPEDERAYIEAISLAKSIDADIIITTDPDGDRIGLGVKHEGTYVLLNGNQTGSLILDYLLTYKKHSKDSLVISSIVTTSLIEAISKKHGVHFEQTLTGFKYIGDTITRYQGTKDFMFAVEESYGCALSPIVRDKDSLQAALIITEMACLYKNKGYTLVDHLNKLYDAYGFYFDKVVSYSLDPLTGIEEVTRIMNTLRKNKVSTIANYKVVKTEDYLEELENFPKSNVLRYIFEDGSFIAIRPSGTEPKYKIYYSLVAKDKEDSQTKFVSLQNSLQELIK